MTSGEFPLHHFYPFIFNIVGVRLIPWVHTYNYMAFFYTFFINDSAFPGYACTYKGAYDTTRNAPCSCTCSGCEQVARLLLILYPVLRWMHRQLQGLLQ